MMKMLDQAFKVRKRNAPVLLSGSLCRALKKERRVYYGNEKRVLRSRDENS